MTPLQIQCPVCNAAAGERCNAPTDNGRRNVEWFHMLREDRALISFEKLLSRLKGVE